MNLIYLILRVQFNFSDSVFFIQDEVLSLLLLTLDSS